MDPNAVLKEIRKLIERASDLESFPRPDPAELLTELASAVEDLDEWLTKGGFLPSAWELNRTTVWELPTNELTKMIDDAQRAWVRQGLQARFRLAVDAGEFKWDAGNGWTVGVEATGKAAQG